MRQIEKRLLEAIRENKVFKCGNTQYIPVGYYAPDSRESRASWQYTPMGCEHPASDGIVYLHGNAICRVKPDGTRLYSSAGWMTVTTKSRLNALGAGIYQRNYTWYANGIEFEDQF